jgi:phage terminase small subunit
MASSGFAAGDRLTDQQRAFILHYTSDPHSIGNGAEAARRAGYSHRSAGELARQLLEKPHVREAIDQANRHALGGRISTKAVALLERVLDDETAPLKTRVEAAKTVLDRAGILAPSVGERMLSAARNGRTKPIFEMTVEEIRDEIQRLESETKELEGLSLSSSPVVLEGEAVEGQH